MARDFRSGPAGVCAETFAATPPWESARMLLSLSRVRRSTDSLEKGRMKLMFIDVRKAHLNGRVPAGENRYVELPEELGMPSHVGKMRRWLYGMRPAASAWEAAYSAKLKSIGFKKGSASAAMGLPSRCGVTISSSLDFIASCWS